MVRSVQARPPEHFRGGIYTELDRISVRMLHNRFMKWGEQWHEHFQRDADKTEYSGFGNSQGAR